MKIAVDGPSGAGKSSVCKEVAKRLNINYLDTGAMYRSVAYEMLKERVNFRFIGQFLEKLKIDVKYTGGVQRMYVNGEDVTDKIRTPENSMMTSKISAIGAVREFLLGLQRDIANVNDVIIDGRDIGTVVLPDADVKLFITASADVRARRRLNELGLPETEFERILSDINKRDYDDSHREIAPLMKADDAMTLDTSNFSFEQVVESVIEIIKENWGNDNMNGISDIAARIIELREVCGYTAESLADELSVPRVKYYEYEKTGDFPISVIFEISNKFGVDFNELVTGETARLTTFQVIKRGGGRSINRFEGYRYKDLAYKMKNKIMQPLLVTLDPSDEPASLVSHPGEEFNLVLRGKVAVTIDGHELILEEGDSVYFNSSLPHGQKCAGDEKARFVTIISEQK
ncbi:MAG: (d)CMP kinase [Ruminococcus sp.]|jgi:cytidylate kinase|nr:(d)CMP kinase [Ruminococcus sp.]